MRSADAIATVALATPAPSRTKVGSIKSAGLPSLKVVRPLLTMRVRALVCESAAISELAIKAANEPPRTNAMRATREMARLERHLRPPV